MAGLIKAVLALEHGTLPPNVNVGTPNPRIRFARSPFRLNPSTMDCTGEGPRRAGVSSFGMGGTNAHVILEQAPPVQAGEPTSEPQLIPLSAKTAGALDALAGDVAEHLQTRPVALADVAATLRRGRARLTQRRVVVAADRESVTSARRCCGRTSGWTCATPCTARARPCTRPG